MCTLGPIPTKAVVPEMTNPLASPPHCPISSSEGAAAPAEADPSRLREDQAPSPLAADEALAMAPESEDGFFVVPAFVESPEP